MKDVASPSSTDHDWEPHHPYKKGGKQKEKRRSRKHTSCEPCESLLLLPPPQTAELTSFALSSLVSFQQRCFPPPLVLIHFFAFSDRKVNCANCK